MDVVQGRRALTRAQAGANQGEERRVKWLGRRLEQRRQQARVTKKSGVSARR